MMGHRRGLSLISTLIIKSVFIKRVVSLSLVLPDDGTQTRIVPNLYSYHQICVDKKGLIHTSFTS